MRPPTPKRLFGRLVDDGGSGGLVPCPKGSEVMLVAIGLDWVMSGLGLILAFSLGLAAVFIAFGVLVVHSRSKLVNLLGKPGSPWRRLLSPISAVVAALLGVGTVP